MMSGWRWQSSSLALAVWLTASVAGAAELPCEVLAPVLGAAGTPEVQAGPDQRPYPVFQAAGTNPITEGTRRVLAEEPAQRVLRYADWASRRAQEPGTKPAPVFLALTDEDGGFARTGFWLQDGGGHRAFVEGDYVNLVVDQRSLDSGNFEEIFAHETGHIILRRLAGELPGRRTEKYHQSMAITDRVTAFDEGYATHFQPLVREATGNPMVKRWMSGAGADDLNQFWLGDTDTALRTLGVKTNVFIHAKRLQSGGDVYRRLTDAEASTVFDPVALRNPQQMVASEGVAATFFYRIANDDALRDRYLDAAFYRRYLPGAPDDPKQAVTPEDNAALKIIETFHAMRTATEGASPLTRFVKTFAATFPEDANRIRALYVATTWGATASRPLAEAFVRTAEAGKRGDMEAFRRENPFERLQAVLADPKLDIDAEIGPELWVANPGFLLQRYPWEPERTLALTADLNTAGEAEVEAALDVTPELASAIVRARETRGRFDRLDDVLALLPDADRKRVAALQLNGG
jgi:hypothetical protein